jgi:hypothetical protein
MYQSHEQWLVQGVPVSYLDEIAQLAPIEKWDIEWQSYYQEDELHSGDPEDLDPGEGLGAWITRVRCPKCGSEGTYHLEAVTDFQCDYEDDCGFDVLDNDEGFVPLPGQF